MCSNDVEAVDKSVVLEVLQWKTSVYVHAPKMNACVLCHFLCHLKFYRTNDIASGIAVNPFQGSAYNLQLISVT